MTAVAALVALPAAATVIWLILRTGAASRMLARPRADRWHERTTPLGGGVGIFAGLVAAIGAGLLTDDVAGSSELYGILAGCTILFAAGLLDDRFSLGPLAKIAAQASAVAIVIASGVSVRLVENDYLATGIAVVWLIGVTNAFNLLDNMDGLAATLAAIAAGYFAIDAVTIHPSDSVLLLSLGIGLACVGFLPFNIRPGRPAAIFMGDSGSQVIGFALASLGLYASWNVAGTTVATLLLPILILAIPIFDTALVTIVRLLEGRPIYQGGLDHTSHRIVHRGLSERRALVLLAVISAALGGTSLAYNVLDNSRIALAGVLVTFALLVQFATIIGDVDRRGTVSERGPWLLRTFVVHRRRLIEVVVDAALVCASFLAAYLLVVEGSGSINQRHVFWTTLPVLLAARYGSFIVFGLYRSVWRYAGARDAASVITAVGVSSLACYGIVEATRDFGDFPLSIFVVDGLICAVFVGATRFAERGIHTAFSSLRDRGKRQRTLIVGAGRAGRSLLRELRETPGEQVVGFVDDDTRLRARRLQGAPVLGSTAEIEVILARSSPDVVLVTIPEAPRDRLDLVVQGCEQAEVPCRFVRRELDLEPASVLGVLTK